MSAERVLTCDSARGPWPVSRAPVPRRALRAPPAVSATRAQIVQRTKRAPNESAENINARLHTNGTNALRHSGGPSACHHIHLELDDASVSFPYERHQRLKTRSTFQQQV